MPGASLSAAAGKEEFFLRILFHNRVNEILESRKLDRNWDKYSI
jgi:hypothetical protein